MLSIVHSATIIGIEAHPITVEVDISNGMPGFNIVGLPDSVVKESRDRVFAAIRNSGYSVPIKKMIVSLAPADLRKEGSAFDLPIALAVLLASEQINELPLDNVLVIGELSLEGKIKPIKGLLSIAAYLHTHQNYSLIFPRENLSEASAFSNISKYSIHELKDIETILNCPSIDLIEEEGELINRYEHLDFADVKGQEQSKRALEIAAAGSHNILMVGSPGCGKSLMARRIPSILPPMTREESLTTTMIYSSAGLLSPGQGLIKERPFRSPHHIISNTALIGGGAYPKPGEVSLAHNGILFLDEFPEFPKLVLESLRQPIEDGSVTIARTAITLTYPCQLMLSAAMNPCPCGYMMHPKKECVCTPFQVRKYLAKISGPLLDRMDIQIEIPSLNYKELSSRSVNRSSECIREKVLGAKGAQLMRFKSKQGIFFNSQMGPKDIAEFCELNSGAKSLLHDVVEKMGLSARAYDRILKMARTIADVEGYEGIGEDHVAEAIHYRSLDRLREFVK